IENFDELKRRLLEAGHTFTSSTDTEVLAHLIGEHYARIKAPASDVHPLAAAVIAALPELVGTYGLAVICTEHPHVIIGARRGSPLIVGVGDGENLLASDASALVSHTRKVVYLEENEVVTLSRDNFDVRKPGSGATQVQIRQIDYSPEAAEKGCYP